MSILQVMELNLGLVNSNPFLFKIFIDKEKENMLLIIISVVLLLLLVGAFIWSIATTPENLKGYYRFRYLLIALIAIAAIILLCTNGLFDFFN